MAIARYLECMSLALRASGLWLRYAALQNVIPSFPWIASHALHPGAIQGKEGIQFCHLATLCSGPGLGEKSTWKRTMRLMRLMTVIKGGSILFLRPKKVFGTITRHTPMRKSSPYILIVNLVIISPTWSRKLTAQNAKSWCCTARDHTYMTFRT